MEPDFELYLSEKKIDSQAFKKDEPEKWQQFLEIFSQVNPASFTVQKKFLINDLRRLYPLKMVPPVIQPATEKVKTEESNMEEPKKAARPVVRRAPVIKKPATGSEETSE
jgi:hypothetical protein